MNKIGWFWAWNLEKWRTNIFKQFAHFSIAAVRQCPVSGSWEADSGVWANSLANFLRPSLSLWLPCQKVTDKKDYFQWKSNHFVNTILYRGKRQLVYFGLTRWFTPWVQGLSFCHQHQHSHHTYHHYKLLKPNAKDMIWWCASRLIYATLIHWSTGCFF